MKRSLLSFINLFFVIALFATTHEVTLQGTSFTPKDLLIQAGDTVVWKNIDGFHNVNGTQTEYPANPESFTNGADASEPWEFTFVFDKPGFYNYHCDPHRSVGMLGTVTVTAAVVITEIMYNSPSVDSLEFIELYNNGSTAVNLKDYTFDGISYTFPGYNLGAGEYVIVAVDSVAFTNNFGIPAFQFVSGSLNNGGELVRLIDDLGITVDSVDYDDSNGWPIAADGLGASLVLCDANADNNDPANWQAASTMTGVNIDGFEVFANPGGTSQCLQGPVFYILDDDFEVGEDVGEVSFRVVLENGEPGTFSVFSRVLGTSSATQDADFTYPENTMIEFTDVTSDTMTITLMIIDDILAEGVEKIEIDLNFPSDGAAINPLRNTLTISIQDNDVLIPAIVINEIMYNPPEAGTDSLEYIELYSNANSGVDLLGYAFTLGVEYTFPAITIQPGEYLIVAVDSAAFQRNFNIPALQWTSGALGNGGETLELRDAEGNIVDVVTYDDAGDWPTEPDGSGAALILCDVNADNDVGTNWKAATKATGVFSGDGQLLGSPGAANNCEEPGDPSFPAYGIGVVTTVNEEGRADSLGVKCQLQGVVYGVNMRSSGLQFTLIDSNNDGIGVFSSAETFGYTVNEGDEIILKGEVTQFRGLTQFVPSDLTFVSAGNDLFAPQAVTQLGEETESQLVTIENLTVGTVTTDSGGANAEVSNGTTTFLMRIDAETGLTVDDIPTTAFNLTGIGGQFDLDGNAPFDDGYQLLPRYLADIKLLDATFDPTIDELVKVFPNPASLQLQINMTEAFESLRLVDMLGREVLRITEPQLSESVDLQALAPGMYHLQFVKENRFWTTKFVKQ